MKLYIIVEKNTEYNDEYDYFTGGGTNVKAYRSKENAEAERLALEQAKRKSGSYQFEDGEREDLYTIEEVEVEDTQVEYGVLKEAAKSARRVRIDAARSHFEETSKRIFAEHPKLLAFSWTQYTPYFNDGDSCVFSANTEDFKLKVEGWEPDSDDDDGFGYCSKWYLEKHSCDYTPEALAAGKAVVDLLQSIEEDDYEALFGDHAEVVVTREGAKAEHYEHD